ncbi:MAG: hypothetical protein MI921_12455 [Cytophagales bacterium]|nr:hypothetical protein [Cytophagales bacterium]
MAKIYGLDQAVKIIIQDVEYYQSLDQKDRSNMRVYRQRFLDGKLNFETKIKMVKKYGGEVTVDVKVKLK